MRRLSENNVGGTEMKSAAKRILVVLLCVLMFASMLPVSAEAVGSYGALSTKKVPIQYPTVFFRDVMVAKLTGAKKNGGPYIVPKPETGNGDLGIVKNGSNVIILAEDGDYYFYMTTGGKLGWTNKQYFTEPTVVEDGYLFGKSGLTVSDIRDVKDFLDDGPCGYASKSFYASRAVLVMKKGETKKISLHRKWRTRKGVTYTIYYNKSTLSPKFIGNGTNCKVQLKAKAKGPTYLHFSNDYNDQEFHVMVIIT